MDIIPESSSSDEDLKDKFNDSDVGSSSEESLKKINENLKDSKVKTTEEFNDLIKCYICLNTSVNPVICRYCGNIACKICFYKWLESHSKCGCCRRNISEFDLISPPIISKINLYLKEIQIRTDLDKCEIHKEKILFFCVNCVKKYCGKCLAFNSEESKNHIGHKILDYQEIKCSEYNELINKLDSTNNLKNKIDIDLKAYENNKKNNKIKFQNLSFAIEFFNKIIFSKFDEKNRSISNKSNELEETKKKIDLNCKNIFTNLQKLENAKEKIEGFDPVKSCQNLKKEMERVNEIGKEIQKIENNNNNIEYKSFNFTIKRTYIDITKSQKKSINIELPFKIVIQYEEDNYFSITIPNKYQPKSHEKVYYIFPLLNLNNKKLYEFKKLKYQDINNSMESEDDIEEYDGKNEEFKYKQIIKMGELVQDENIFNFIGYSFCIY